MKPTDFSIHVTAFLTHYLAAQRNVSPNTIKAYRDVFTLLLRFCRDVQGIAPEKLRLEQIDVSVVEDSWITWREKGSLRPAHETIALPLCTHSSDMFRPKNRTICFSVKKSSPFPSGDALVPRSRIFPNKSWLRFWPSRTSEPKEAEEMRFC